nr:hypothetical protein B0A51_16006 [Rachicladosporium sp. CCFEE 5018]
MSPSSSPLRRDATEGFTRQHPQIANDSLAPQQASLTDARCAAQQSFIERLQDKSRRNIANLNAADREIDRLHARLDDIDLDHVLEVYTDVAKEVVKKVEKSMSEVRQEYNALERQIAAREEETVSSCEEVSQLKIDRLDEYRLRKEAGRQVRDLLAVHDRMKRQQRQHQHQVQQPTPEHTPEADGHAQLDAELDAYFERGSEEGAALDDRD